MKSRGSWCSRPRWSDMARREKRVTITTAGRDKGKTFVVVELPAYHGERWANRMVLALLNANTRLPSAAREGGMAALAGMMPTNLAGSIRWLAGLQFPEIEDLLAEQLQSIRYAPGVPGAPEQSLELDGPLAQVEEIGTLWELRSEWLELHLGFLLPAAASTTDTAPSAASPG
jgi:hypothetical protein